jgi:hypothetical protein
MVGVGLASARARMPKRRNQAGACLDDRRIGTEGD